MLEAAPLATRIILWTKHINKSVRDLSEASLKYWSHSVKWRDGKNTPLFLYIIGYVSTLYYYFYYCRTFQICTVSILDEDFSKDILCWSDGSPYKIGNALKQASLNPIAVKIYSLSDGDIGL